MRARSRPTHRTLLTFTNVSSTNMADPSNKIFTINVLKCYAPLRLRVSPRWVASWCPPNSRLLTVFRLIKLGWARLPTRIGGGCEVDLPQPRVTCPLACSKKRVAGLGPEVGSFPGLGFAHYAVYDPHDFVSQLHKPKSTIVSMPKVRLPTHKESICEIKAPTTV